MYIQINASPIWITVCICFRYKKFVEYTKFSDDLTHVHISTDGTFYRGCMEEQSTGRQLCEEDAARCEVCDENMCNIEKSWEMNTASQRLDTCYSSSLLFALAIWCFLNNK